MPVVKGGVWTNIEDEILKASVSKYGLNQWARVSSLLARKTPKQCKARWSEWLDPSIRKIEWSKEEDEKLLHLAKLMPTQWRTIAPIVGRTATQCLERYQKLLDEAEARENDELGLGGPEGGETSAPTGDDVRRLRPGELDPDPESKPARPDTIDLDEDEKEMLSEARARLANTQGKKAKRKARERQLEESRRLAVLQKRRELKNAGINIKIVNKKKGQMDYNADIPFEKQATSGFYDTQDEQAKNEREREMFDPRKQQLARKRQGDPEDGPDQKKQKHDKSGQSALAAAAAKAGQMQALREREQQSKRRALTLPAPQVSEAELEEIVKMGMAGDRAAKASGDDSGLISATPSHMVGATPIRTPRAPAQEDHIANTIRDIRALTDTQSSLLGGENTPLHQDAASTGFDGIAPRRQNMVTPNPMATPFRQGGPPGLLTPAVGATPLRTPRDNFAINAPSDPDAVRRKALRAKLSSLPRPKETDFELEELPSEQPETNRHTETSQEDQDEIDRREAARKQAEADADFKRQTQVFQRGLPRPRNTDLTLLLQQASLIEDETKREIAIAAAKLIANDAFTHPLNDSTPIRATNFKLDILPDPYLAAARAELVSSVAGPKLDAFVSTYETQASDADTLLPHLTVPEYTARFASTDTALLSTAEAGNALEKKLATLHGGYIKRAATLRAKIIETSEKVEEARIAKDTFETLRIMEEGALARRLEGLREEVGMVSRREREGQDEFKGLREELRGLEKGTVNGNGMNGVH
jgi:pre-mRNA-splicing factor CDC5/CEF1